MLLGNLQGPVLLLGLILSFSAMLILDNSPAMPTPSEDHCSDAEPVVIYRNYLGASLDLPASAFKVLCVIPAHIAGYTSGLLPCRTQKCLSQSTSTGRCRRSWVPSTKFVQAALYAFQ